MEYTRQRFDFAKRASAAALAVALACGMAPGVALASDDTSQAPSSGMELYAQQKTPDGWAMVEGQAYDVPVTYNANLNSYLDTTAPASVMWDGGKYEVTVKMNPFTQPSAFKFIFEEGTYAGEYSWDSEARTVTFPLESLTSEKLSFKFNFGLGFNTVAEITFDTSGLPTEFEGAEEPDQPGAMTLEDGTYTVNVAAKNKSAISDDSMLNEALVSPATVVVEGDEYYLQLDFKGIYLEVGAITGTFYPTGIKYYTEGCTVVGNVATPQGTTMLADIVAYQEDGTNPKTVKFKLPQSAIETGYAAVAMSVDGINVMGEQDAIVEIDWDSAQVAEPEDPVVEDQMAVGKTYAVPVSFLQDDGSASMAGNMIAKNAIVVPQEDGTYQVTLVVNSGAQGGYYFQALTFDGTEASRAYDADGNYVFTGTVNSLDELSEVGFTYYIYAMGRGMTHSANASFDDEAFEASDGIKMADATVKADLDAAIAAAQKLEQGQKTDDAWSALQDAIAAAQRASSNPMIPQVGVDGSTDALIEAMQAFNASEDVTEPEPMPVVTDELATAIEQAGAIEQGNKSDEAWDALQQAIADAQTALEAAESQEAVDEAVDALGNAVDAFIASEDVTGPGPDNPGTTNPENPNGQGGSDNPDPANPNNPSGGNNGQNANNSAQDNSGADKGGTFAKTNDGAPMMVATAGILGGFSALAAAVALFVRRKLGMRG